MSSRAAKIDKPPMLPPKKIPPDPDYEIIEFSNEQYSNAQPIKAASTLNTHIHLMTFNFILRIKLMI